MSTALETMCSSKPLSHLSTPQFSELCHSVAPIEHADSDTRTSYITTIDQTIDELTLAKNEFMDDNNIKKLYNKLS